MSKRLAFAPKQIFEAPGTEKDIFLCHTGADKEWTEDLAGRVEAERYKDRNLRVIFDKWDFSKGANIVLDIEKEIEACRFVGVIVSKAMLGAPWPTLERTIAVWSDPSGSKGRVIPLLKENVTLPPSLRVRNWIDFRNPDQFEESFAELVRVLRGAPRPRSRGSLLPNIPEKQLPHEPAPIVITSSIAPDQIQERLLSNLYPVLELPKVVHGMKTTIRKKSQIHDHYESKDIAPFILREGKLFSFSPLFGEATTRGKEREKPEQLAEWFSDADRRRWAIELLNVSFRQHAWKRHLRFDATHSRYFFLPRDGYPKRISWNIGGKWVSREVTTRHMIQKVNADGQKELVQFGWRQQGIHANFVLLPSGLFLRIEPTWLLTKPDGNAARGGRRVGPILSHWLNQERNGQILRSLRFWSLVLSRGGNEIVIGTGQEPIRIGLIQDSGYTRVGILSDQMDYDSLMKTEMEDDLNVPQLGLFRGNDSISEVVNEERDPE